MALATEHDAATLLKFAEFCVGEKLYGCTADTVRLVQESTSNLLLDLQKAAAYYDAMNEAGANPISNPALFFASKSKEVVILRQRAKWYRELLVSALGFLGSSKDHLKNNNLFSPTTTPGGDPATVPVFNPKAATKGGEGGAAQYELSVPCYAAFLESALQLESWANVTIELLQVTSGSTSSTTQRGSNNSTAVPSTTAVDVSEKYLSFQASSNLFFSDTSTQFDPRLQRRLLRPQYFVALRAHLDEMNGEVQRMKDVSEVSRSMPVAFRPSIVEFQYLHDSLAIHLAHSATEDELTSVIYFRILYDRSCKEFDTAKEIVTLNVLEPARKEQQASRGAHQGTDQSTKVAANSAVSTALSVFDDLRVRVLSLQTALEREIRDKNRTHATLQRNDLVGEGDAAEPSKLQAFWGTIMCCQASDARRQRPRVSPLHEQKLQMMLLIMNLIDEVETLATQLEHCCSEYSRDWKHRVARVGNRVVSSLESVTVVFGRGTAPGRSDDRVASLPTGRGAHEL